MPEQPADLAKLTEMLDGVRFTMFTTRSEGGLRSRPMTTLETDAAGSIWFFGTQDSDLTDEIKADPQVVLTYADNGAGRYVSVRGIATPRDDRAKVKELWNPIHKAWYEGEDDAKLQLIEVQIESADYWDGPKSRLVRMASIVAAAVTGREYGAGEEGEIKVAGSTR